MKRILISFGTRPEILKLISIISEFKQKDKAHELFIVNTSQHDTLMQETFKDYDIAVDYTFDLGQRDCSLDNLLGRLMLNFAELKSHLANNDLVINACIVQGDTSSSYSTTMFSYHNNIPVFHVEAGLRTHDIQSPHPEEFYRKSISQIALFHFAPTIIQKRNLLKEGINENKIVLTGNSIIDLLSNTIKQENKRSKIALITLHRSPGDLNGRKKYVDFIKQLAEQNKDWKLILLNHPNHSDCFSKLETDNLEYSSFKSYPEMMDIYSRCSIIYSDSGGIQEEACFIGVPCVIFREKTERLEGIEAGVSRIVDLSQKSIQKELQNFDLEKMHDSKFIYGEGNCGKIVYESVMNYLSFN